jgi:hypothetical protein
MLLRIFILTSFLLTLPWSHAASAEKLTGIHSAMVMAQCLPWIARETGLFQKHDLDFQLIYIASSPTVTGALLGRDAEIALTGGSAETAYHTNIGSLEPKLTITPEAVQAILDEVAQGDPSAKKVQAQDLIDRRYLDALEKSGFFKQLWKK